MLKFLTDNSSITASDQAALLNADSGKQRTFCANAHRMASGNDINITLETRSSATANGKNNTLVYLADHDSQTQVSELSASDSQSVAQDFANNAYKMALTGVELVLLPTIDPLQTNSNIIGEFTTNYGREYIIWKHSSPENSVGDEVSAVLQEGYHLINYQLYTGSLISYNFDGETISSIWRNIPTEFTTQVSPTPSNGFALFFPNAYGQSPYSYVSTASAPFPSSIYDSDDNSETLGNVLSNESPADEVDDNGNRLYLFFYVFSKTPVPPDSVQDGDVFLALDASDGGIIPTQPVNPGDQLSIYLDENFTYASEPLKIIDTSNMDTVIANDSSYTVTTADYGKTLVAVVQNPYSGNVVYSNEVTVVTPEDRYAISEKELFTTPVFGSDATDRWFQTGTSNGPDEYWSRGQDFGLAVGVFGGGVWDGFNNYRGNVMYCRFESSNDADMIEDWLISKPFTVHDNLKDLHVILTHTQNFIPNYQTTFKVFISTSGDGCPRDANGNVIYALGGLGRGEIDYNNFDKSVFGSNPIASYEETDLNTFDFDYNGSYWHDPEGNSGTQYGRSVITIPSSSLSIYQGQTVHLAFVHVQDDGDDWIIKNVEVQSIVEGTPPTVQVFQEDFATDPAGNGWTVFGQSASGGADNGPNYTWEWDTDGYIWSYFENTPGAQDDCQDWLVTPSLFFDPGVSNLEIELTHANYYTAAYGSELKVFISYTGSTSNDFTNDPVAVFSESDVGTLQGGDSFTVSTISVGSDILGNYTGTGIWIAFVHEQDDGDIWYIENVKVTAQIDNLKNRKTKTTITHRIKTQYNKTKDTKTPDNKRLKRLDIRKREGGKIKDRKIENRKIENRKIENRKIENRKIQHHKIVERKRVNLKKK